MCTSRVVQVGGLLSVVVAVLMCGCVHQPSAPEYTQNESMQIAEQFIRTAPTFAYDAIEDSLVLVSTKQLGSSAWEFTYTFRCRTAGYGNRSGMMVAQVLTNHTAVIRVERGDVVYAVYDGRWDELNQRMVGE
ncbi:MAG: hypothetical protein ACXQS1_02265 [Methermicoccaceae archaeon]